MTVTVRGKTSSRSAGMENPGTKPVMTLSFERQKHRTDHSQHDRQRAQAHDLAYSAGNSEDSNQNACSDIGRHHLGEAEVIERRTDEDGAWDRPGNATGLAVQITRHNGQQSWNRVGAKYPCRDLVVFKVSLRRDGKENGERACDGEEPSNHGVGDRMTVQRRAKISPARQRPRDGLDDRDVRIGGAIAAHTTSDSRSLFSSSVAPILRTGATGPARASCMNLQATGAGPLFEAANPANGCNCVQDPPWVWADTLSVRRTVRMLEPYRADGKTVPG